MTWGNCKQFTFEEEFQRIRECVELMCDQGPSPSSSGVESWDVVPLSRVSIVGTSFTDILSYDIPYTETLLLFGAEVNLIGFAAEIVVEKYNNPDGWSLMRSYVLNTQKPDHYERLSSPMTLKTELGYLKIRVRARMLHAAGSNGNGSIFAGLNGFRIVPPIV